MPRKPDMPILLIDGDSAWAQGLRSRLEQAAGFNNFILCSQGSESSRLLEKLAFSLVLLEVSMPAPGGEELLGQIATLASKTPVIVVSAISAHQSVVESMRLGAYDYFVKGHDEMLLIASMHRALKLHSLEQEHQMHQARFRDHRVEQATPFQPALGKSPRMQQIFSYLEAAASSRQPLLVTGESGTGKELVARTVHQLSGCEGPWVAVNVAGLDDNVFSDTLFGHVAGAFTGADKARSGMVESAQHGTLFLDEIGDLSLASQLKLLRLLQEGECYPLGADKPRISSARLVVATNVDLVQAQHEGAFRQDLLYRLNAHHVHLPPLCERREDLSHLLGIFLQQAAEELNKPIPTPPDELLALLRTYAFPGNIRELQGMVYEAVSQHKRGKLSMGTFVRAMGLENKESTINSRTLSKAKVIFGESLPALDEVGNLLVTEAMARAEGNQSLAARLIGISRQALAKRLKNLER